MEFEVIVRAIMVSEGKVLFQRNVRTDEFALPGGHVEVGETLMETLRRELMEETYLEIEVGRPVYVAENFFEQEGREYHEIGFYFLVDVLGDIPESVRSKEGHIDFWFLDLEELSERAVYPSFLRTILPEDAKNDFAGPLKLILQRDDDFSVG